MKKRTIINGRKRVPANLTPYERLDWFAAPKKEQNGCRLWLGRVNSDGYANFEIKSKYYSAARTALERKLGRKLKPKKEACHTCHVRSCVEPSHLYEGTRLSNMRDRVTAGRYATQPKGSQQSNAKLTEADVKKIRRDTRYNYEIAADYGVSTPNIWKIKHRLNWTHVP